MAEEHPHGVGVGAGCTKRAPFQVGPSKIGAFFHFHCGRQLHLAANRASRLAFLATQHGSPAASSSLPSKAGSAHEASQSHRSAVTQRGLDWEAALNALLIQPPLSRRLIDVEACCAGDDARCLAMSMDLFRTAAPGSVIYQVRSVPCGMTLLKFLCRGMFLGSGEFTVLHVAAQPSQSTCFSVLCWRY